MRRLYELKHWVIIYDICDARRLRKVAKLTENFVTRVQKSVFEGDLRYKDLLILKSLLEKAINPEVDYIVFFDICENDWQKKSRFGPGRYIETQDKPYYIV